jgi:transposase-like protein
VLYHLKTAYQTVGLVLWLLALGVDFSALEEACGIRESTIRTWMCRSGEHGKKLLERSLSELELVHVQLDELWGDVKLAGQEVWIWVAVDVKTKLIPVLAAGARTQEVAYEVVHELAEGRMRARVQHGRTQAL